MRSIFISCVCHVCYCENMKIYYISEISFGWCFYDCWKQTRKQSTVLCSKTHTQTHIFIFYVWDGAKDIIIIHTFSLVCSRYSTAFACSARKLNINVKINKILSVVHASKSYIESHKCQNLIISLELIIRACNLYDYFI